MKAFTVSSKDLFDKKKNPTLSLSVNDIAKNKRIKKHFLNKHGSQSDTEFNDWLNQ